MGHKTKERFNIGVVLNSCDRSFGEPQCHQIACMAIPVLSYAVSSCTIFCSPDSSHSFQIHHVQFCHILFYPTLSHPILPLSHVCPPCGLATCEGICAPAEPDPFPCMPIPFSVKNSSRSMYCSWNRPPSQGSVRSHSSGPRNADCELGRSAPEP